MPSKPMQSKHSLRRRTLLRGSLGLGAGTVVGLPLLEAMLDRNGTALADGSPLPMQLVMWFMGNGYRIEQLEPAATGADFALTPQLAPFANVEPYVSIATGLQNWCYAQVTHHEGMTAWSGYNMAQLSGLFSKSGGPTLDQVVADHIEANAPSKPLVKSVQIGISKRTSIMDSGTTMFAVSHRGTNEPLFPEFNPQKVYATLFGEYQPKPDDSALRLSVLDSVKQDAKKLEARLGSADKARLEAHLDGIRQLEDRIKAVPPTCDVPGMPSETNADVNGDEPLDSVNKAMSDLLVYAMKCDITRVASCMFIGGAAETTYTEIAQQVGHHYNTHDPSAQAAVHDGVVYAHGKLAYLLEQMQATVDPMGLSLLDSGLVLAGSDCSVGLTHSVSRQPYILVG
ncbi:MAG TPA: DUF1552 domain-containing protein, partial [Polyangiaceae bacterium]|nr:DUF1552 domain-containing protein [Polyangiaceae bacterium]